MHSFRCSLLRPQEADDRAAKSRKGGGAADRYPSPPPPLVPAWEWGKERVAGVFDGGSKVGAASDAAAAARQGLPEQIGLRRDEIEAFLE